MSDTTQARVEGTLDPLLAALDLISKKAWERRKRLSSIPDREPHAEQCHTRAHSLFDLAEIVEAVRKEVSANTTGLLRQAKKEKTA